MVVVHVQSVALTKRSEWFRIEKDFIIHRLVKQNVPIVGCVSKFVLLKTM